MNLVNRSDICPVHTGRSVHVRRRCLTVGWSKIHITCWHAIVICAHQACPLTKHRQRVQSHLSLPIIHCHSLVHVLHASANPFLAPVYFSSLKKYASCRHIVPSNGTLAPLVVSIHSCVVVVSSSQGGRQRIPHGQVASLL